MFYTSSFRSKGLSFLVNKIKRDLEKIKNKEKCLIGLGFIAKGILTTKSILSPEDLEKDLKSVKNAGFDKVVIFRLGGLDKDYMRVLERFR